MLSVGDDDVAESDLESNLVQLNNYQDGDKTVEEGVFLLPADSWKDLNMLDWILSIKTKGEDSTESLFNTLITE
jgi:hypothetical protein